MEHTCLLVCSSIGCLSIYLCSRSSSNLSYRHSLVHIILYSSWSRWQSNRCRCRLGSKVSRLSPLGLHKAHTYCCKRCSIHLVGSKVGSPLHHKSCHDKMCNLCCRRQSGSKDNRLSCRLAVFCQHMFFRDLTEFTSSLMSIR